MGTGIGPRRAARCSTEDAHTFLAPSLSCLSEGSRLDLAQTDTGLNSGLARNSTFLLSLPKGWGARARGSPRFPRARPRPTPAHAGPTGVLPPLHSPAPATWVRLQDLGRPRLPTRPPTGLSFQSQQECRGPGLRCGRERGRRPSWGAGQSGWAARRGRRRAPPLLSGPCQCFALGACVRLGVLPQGSGTRAPPASGPFRGSGRPAALSRPGAGSRGRRRPGGGRGRGRGLGARWPVIG